MTFSKDRLLTESEACLLIKEDRQHRVPDVITPLNSNSSWVCCDQVAQVLDRQKVQRIAPNEWLLTVSSRCLIDSRRVGAVPHQVCRSTAGVVP